jgi:putative DNA primase/helicase
VAFLAWLREIFADHGEDLDKAIELLQMWYGYCLTSDTSQQKMLVLTGPSRSGKSTIEKVLRCLLGQDNVAGIRLSSFQEQFGLSTLIGRQLAVMGDVRVGKSDRGEITQKLLSVIGEDVLDIDRKYKTPISSKVNAKLMLIGNEVPSLYDESGALRARYALLETTRSFKGNEDVGIEKRFFAEAEGILLWAVEGWRKLRKGQKFPVLGLAETYLEILSDDTAPVSSYVGERLVVADRGDVDDTWASSEGLYVDYTWWCGEAGRQPFARATFFKKLRAELPFLRPSRRRVEIDGERKQAQGYAGVSVKPNGPSL